MAVFRAPGWYGPYPSVKIEFIDGHAREIAKRVGLETVLDRRPGTLPFADLRKIEVAKAIARNPKVLLIVYPHILSSREDVVEWVKGTMLTAYKRRLPENVYDQFVAEYRARLLPRLEDSRPFFYPFKRILCWGRRA